ncbi:hypothetical protein PsorP6_010862 [Peronosclerospora sorghi]|uniref:Uncharacterized protein n=1 Tax=Peronosclerospora sorghi TaxID=230839 RepID=A0ACC0VW13_9STRA|nr:hypothetical protein PsorP6_010862 [Peronosclerospora sorghi]
MGGTHRRSKARQLLLRVRVYVTSHVLSLSWGTFTLGLIWLCLHPAVTITTGEWKCRGTYISENALLIDLLEAQAGQQQVDAAHAYHQKLLQVPALPSTGCGDDCERVIDWIDAQLRGMDRVEVYCQVVQTDATRSKPRTNVYGILRAAPFGDGKESIVLVTHYRHMGLDSGSYTSVSLGLALLQYLAHAKWLAKDVILLAADDGPLDGADGDAAGTRAWLDAYHMDPLETDPDARLPMRAGLVRAALNLETLTCTHDVHAVGVYAAGANGQLPNLDLVNTAVRAFRTHDVPIVLDRSEADGRMASLASVARSLLARLAFVRTPFWTRTVVPYVTRLVGMLQFMTAVATGPSGLHAHFLAYNIDSLTLALTNPRRENGTHARVLSTLQVFRSLELIVRALSNLEGKLHRSYYLYVLPTTTTFVSVGEYLYALVLTLTPALAHVAHLAAHTTGMRVAYALTVLLVVETFGLVVLGGTCYVIVHWTHGLPILTTWMLALGISIGQALVVQRVLPALRSLAILSGCADMATWRLAVRAYETEGASSTSSEHSGIVVQPTRDAGWRAIKMMILALVVVSHGVLGVLNYPMALFGALFTTPFATIVPRATTTTTPSSGARNLWSSVWLVGSSPLGLLCLLSWSGVDVYSGITYLVTSFVDHRNVLALPYFCCVYVALHTLSLGIWLEPAASEKAVKTTKQD